MNYGDRMDYYDDNSSLPDSYFDALLPGFSSLKFEVINSSVQNPSPLPDLTPPRLTNAAFKSSLFDLSQSGSGNVVLTVSVSDQLTGFDYGYFDFISPSGNAEISIGVNNLLSGSPLNGTFFGSEQLGPYAEAGIWRLDSVYLQDQARNDLEVYASDGNLDSLLPGLGDLFFQVINPKSDDTPPNLIGVELNSSVIDLSQPGSGNVGLTVSVLDDLSGFDWGYFRFSSPTGNDSLSIDVSHYRSGTSLNGTFYGSSFLKPNAEAGIWRLASAELEDSAGNDIGVGPDYEGLSVVSLDGLLPSLSALSFEVVDASTVLPVVSFTLSPKNAIEDANVNLVYTFSRTGSTASSLAVNYSISGTADGSDYIGATPGANKVITFWPGSSTATITIDPTADSSVESDETVVLSLQSGSGYTMGPSASATGTILNDDVSPPTYTVLTTVGSVVFQKAAGTNRYSVSVDGVIKPITIQGNPIYEGI
jgi:hypothetical protein